MFDLEVDKIKDMIDRITLEEKDKYCEYCNYDKDDCIAPFDKQGHVYISGSMERTMCISWYGHRKDIHINYCPMCGRKLENSVRRPKNLKERLMEESK